MCFVWCCLIGEALNGFVVVVLFLAFSFCHLCLWGLWLPKPALYFPTSFFDHPGWQKRILSLGCRIIAFILGEGRKMALKIPSYWNQVLDSIRIVVFWTETALLKKRIDSVFDPQVSLFILQFLPHHWVSCWLHPLQLCLRFSMIKKPVSGLGM